jgi:hypothetical protein
MKRSGAGYSRGRRTSIAALVSSLSCASRRITRSVRT